MHENDKRVLGWLFTPFLKYHCCVDVIRFLTAPLHILIVVVVLTQYNTFTLDFDCSEARYGSLLSRYLDDPSNLFIVSSDFCHWGTRFAYTFYDEAQVTCVEGQMHHCQSMQGGPGFMPPPSATHTIPNAEWSCTPSDANRRCSRRVLLAAWSIYMEERTITSLLPWPRACFACRK
jgi:hypothetical protein